MPIGVALIGTGQIAQEHLSCLRQLPGVEVTGVCDRYASLAEMTAERFGIPAWFDDHRRMLEVLKPDVVHITTPPAAHFPLAMDALEAGSHVIVEKPITCCYEDFQALRARALELRRFVMEDHNYLFGEASQRILALVHSGEFGAVQHVDIFYCAGILASGSAFVDADAPHPSLSLPGGAISDFLPHLSYLTYAFVGSHRSVRTLWRKREASSPLPSDEFRALIDAEHGTAAIGFSSHTPVDALWMRVYGSKMQAEANLFEPRLNLIRLRPIHRALVPLRNGIQESWDVAKAAFRGFWRRLSGRPLWSEGLWELLRRTYLALQTGGEPPITLKQVDATSRLVADLTKEEFRI